ncbi:hypothetical protein BGZ72_006979 [Mortierella alpina]|nr:hypothetical protein BGZ72_006979 [Mortierella alpina]
MRNYVFPLAIAMTAMLPLSGDRSWAVSAAPLTAPLSEDIDAKSPLEAWAAGLDERDYDPAVVNYTDWSCKPSKNGANPIILLHGLLAYPPFKSTAYMAEKLTQSGYCVYQLLYGMRPLLPGMPDYGGISDIHESANELSAFVGKVLASTEASHVDLVGHSEGTVVARWYVKFLDGDKKVRSVVSISPVGRGTTLQGLLGVIDVFGGFFKSMMAQVANYCPACVQLLNDSDLLKELYADNQETVHGVRYLNILTREDQIVTPYTNGVMKLEEQDTDPKSARSARQELPSQNLIIEDYCPVVDPAEHSNHFALFRSPFAATATEAFLAGKNGRLGKNDLPCA